MLYELHDCNVNLKLLKWKLDRIFKLSQHKYGFISVISPWLKRFKWKIFLNSKVWGSWEIAFFTCNTLYKQHTSACFSFSYRQLRYEWVRVWPQSRGEEIYFAMSIPLDSEESASLTPPCATRWLSVLYISTHQSCDFCSAKLYPLLIVFVTVTE